MNVLICCLIAFGVEPTGEDEAAAEEDVVVDDLEEEEGGEAEGEAEPAAPAAGSETERQLMSILRHLFGKSTEKVTLLTPACPNLPLQVIVHASCTKPWPLYLCRCTASSKPGLHMQCTSSPHVLSGPRLRTSTSRCARWRLTVQA